MDKMATREAYGNTLAALCEKDKNIIVLDADLSSSTKTRTVCKKTPKQFYNMGIAEANMMGVAAGLAASGNIVFASSFAIFATGRAYEQIRNAIAYPQLNVKICATHAGISVGEDGASHQSFEDMALMRGIPNMTVIHPADGVSCAALIKQICYQEGPCYVRLGRMAVDTIYDKDKTFTVGKGIYLKKGEKIALIANGLMVAKALQAAEELAKVGIFVSVIDMHTLKPIDEELICSLADSHHTFITCEEHSIVNGLGSAVSEVLSEHAPRLMQRIGIRDCYGESGTPQALFEKYHVTSEDIIQAVKKAQK